MSSDRYWPGLVGALVGGLLFAGWLVWSAQAEVTLFERSREASLKTEGDVRWIESRFDGVTALERLKPGQSARVSIHGSRLLQALPAHVVSIDDTIDQGMVGVRLRLERDLNLRPSSGQLDVEVLVEVERVSPLGLLLRAASQ